MNGEYHIGVLGMVDEDLIDTAQLESLDVINRTQLGNIWTFRVPLRSVNSFTEVPGLKYLEIGNKVAPLLNENVADARVDSVHLGLGGLSQAYKGEGVVIGIIDWGFDYTHPVFYNEDLTELRLVRAWDQNKIAGTPPAGFDYGAEYSSLEEFFAIRHDTVTLFGLTSHGTHVAGIAGGSGGGPDAVFSVPGDPEARFVGAAPEAELIFVTQRWDAASMADGLQYIRNYAESVGKPLVVNMSFGAYEGPHDGSSLRSVGIDNFVGPGRVVVSSAGNEGNNDFHLDRNFTVNPDTLITVVNYHPLVDWGQGLIIWGSPNSDFSVSVALVGDDNVEVFRTPLYASQDDNQVDSIFEVGDVNFHFRVQTTAAFTENNMPNINLDMSNTTGLKTVLRLISSDSHVHMWSVGRMEEYYDWGWHLGQNYPGAVPGNNAYGVLEPAVSNKAIAVGAYRAERLQPNGNWIFGGLANFSSRGPSVDGRTKPDITSGGVNVWSAVSTAEAPAQHPLEHNGITYHFQEYSGTSMSGPMVAGIVALMLQERPDLSADEAKEILKSTAREDWATGVLPLNGSNDWGWGKANALAALLATEVLSANESAKLDNSFVRAFPNPTADVLNLQLDVASAGNTQIRVFDLTGKMVRQQHFNAEGAQLSVSLGDLPAGLYLIAIENGDRAAFRKVMVSK